METIDDKNYREIAMLREENERLKEDVERLSAPATRDERCKFALGDQVSKVGGDYRFDGVVVAAFRKLSGVERFVVEDDRGILHIYGPSNIYLSPQANL